MPTNNIYYNKRNTCMVIYFIYNQIGSTKIWKQLYLFNTRLKLGYNI